ncbi:interferon alpha-inducible protein 27-like protein 2 [Ochotona princeps]|uniref:interferon alpha-inducible protein 27-like protein 2 n=1 Tax=Ochotona princeps TaxID=9978 RepID=UPI002714FB68|nr:interferon alpha-inducible protein 27-like protein 2 [Ochotona princeps]
MVLGALGFTAGGIAASSIASSMMSAAAVANGGGVAAGSLVATLQSAGAAGLAASTKAILGAAGAGLGALTARVGRGDILPAVKHTAEEDLLANPHPTRPWRSNMNTVICKHGSCLHFHVGGGRQDRVGLSPVDFVPLSQLSWRDQGRWQVDQARKQ